MKITERVKSIGEVLGEHNRKVLLCVDSLSTAMDTLASVMSAFSGIKTIIYWTASKHDQASLAVRLPQIKVVDVSYLYRELIKESRNPEFAFVVDRSVLDPKNQDDVGFETLVFNSTSPVVIMCRRWGDINPKIRLNMHYALFSSNIVNTHLAQKKLCDKFADGYEPTRISALCSFAGRMLEEPGCLVGVDIGTKLPSLVSDENVRISAYKHEDSECTLFAARGVTDREVTLSYTARTQRNDQGSESDIAKATLGFSATGPAKYQTLVNPQTGKLTIRIEFELL